MAVDPRTGQTDIREALARQLIAQGAGAGPIRHPVQGAAKLAQTLVGALLAKKLQAEGLENTSSRNAGLADALQISRGKPAETVTTSGGESIDFNAQPANPNLALTNLLQNPNTANLSVTQKLLANQLSAGNPAFGQPVAGLDPQGQPAFFQVDKGGRIKQVGGFQPVPKTPLVNISNAEETAEAKALGTLRVDRFDKLSSAADDAERKLQSLDQIDFGMEGFETGAFGPGRLALGQVGQFFGVDTSSLGDISSAESFTAAANKMAIQARGGDGTPLTGATSERDLDFLIESVPSLGKTERGNRMVVEFMRRGARRVIEKKSAADEWLEEKGTFRGFERSWSTFTKQKPLFTDADKQALKIAGLRFSEMTAEQLGTFDMSTLSASNLDEIRQRLSDLRK